MINGFYLINKKAGVTSSWVTQEVKRKFGYKKVGHLGTLDPMAQGLLILAVNRATKFSSLFLDSNKSYEAEITLGIQTNTNDAEGEVISRSRVTSSEDEIKRGILSFLGESMQVPPVYSALKFKGKPLYKHAREGNKIYKEARVIIIYKIDQIDISLPIISLRIECSKGTYIRSIARDLGNKLNCGAYLSNLKRVSQHNFDIQSAKVIEDLSEDDLISLEEPFTYLDSIQLSEVHFQPFINGVGVDIDIQNDDLIRVFGPDGVFVAIGKKTSHGFKHEYLV